MHIDTENKDYSAGNLRDGLTKMKETAEAYLGQPVTEAVITVPAYFMMTNARLPKTLVRSPDWM